MGDIADDHANRYYDDSDFEYGDDSAPATCNRCGKRNLFWEETEQGWRLRDGDKIHVCDVTNMFNIIEEN